MLTLTPERMALQLIAQAPSDDWLRRLTDELDRNVRTKPLERIMSLWGLSASEAAKAFQVSRQAFSKWLKHGVPMERVPVVADLEAATDILDAQVRRDRIPAVVRRSSAMLADRSLYEMACQGEHAEVVEALQRMFDLRRIQP